MSDPDLAAVVDGQRYGPWAVIAGGSEGIGASIAADLARAGVNLVLIARKVEPLEAVAADLRGRLGVEVRTLALDLTDEAMLARVCEATDDIEVGLLVYNAGASHRTGPFLDWPLDDILKVVRLNTVGQTVLAWHFGRKMAARGKGGIVLMGSLAGNAGSPSVIPYAGAKAFSQIFSEGLWWELKPHGVDVLHVVVGSTDTPAMARLGITLRKNAADSPEEVARHTLANLANGPVTVVPSMQARFRALATADRRAATESNAALVMGNTEGTWGKRD
ncbi:SDR family NAD(P)-dependent oxidoreductase [Phenylobacterium sp. LjRoot219]|uniref:SDR family NAD(P)-dependent oxidoreductase n=1 Tax=Phenylobacterium sp. LjRoot219 TaxID=3342283 RepID=UPI003ED07561